MKALIILLVLSVSASVCAAADTLRSNIDQATVFLSGAQVFRETQPFTVPKGVHEVIVGNVSGQLNPNDIQASAKGDFLILDVRFIHEPRVPSEHKPVFVPEKVRNEIEALNDSILFAGFELDRINSKLQTLEAEKQMIVTNKLMKGEGRADSLPILKEAVQFYRLKLDEINKLLQDWKKKQYFANVKRNKLNTRLTELNNFGRKMSAGKQEEKDRYHIKITTYSEKQVSGRIRVNYLIPNAGWIPSYDLRADNVRQPIDVTYKAHVFQNSGEDWKNVKLVLSTYNQNCFTTKPTLGVWRLDYRKEGLTSIGQPDMRFSQNMLSQSEVETFMNNQNNNGYRVENQTFTPLSTISQTNQTFSNVEFEVELPYTVDSDGGHKLMVVSHQSIQARFYHYLLPRANKNGFLLARIGNWEALNLLPGSANIYFKKTYVGKTEIDPGLLSDTLEIAMGMDQGIIAKRQKINDETRKSALGKRRERTLSFEVVLKNNTGSAIELTVEDQIPIAANTDIVVKLVEGGGATYVKESGMLTWKMLLEPGENQKVKFSYSVEYDKDKPIL